MHSSDICVVNVHCADVTADVDGNCSIDLVDAILSLQVSSGVISTDIRSDYSTSGADVSGNNKVGLEEAIGAVRTSAGL